MCLFRYGMSPLSVADVYYHLSNRNYEMVDLVFQSKFWKDTGLPVPLRTCPEIKWFCCRSCQLYRCALGYVMFNVYQGAYSFCKANLQKFRFVLTPDNVDLNGVLDFEDFESGSGQTIDLCFYPVLNCFEKMWSFCGMNMISSFHLDQKGDINQQLLRCLIKLHTDDLEQNGVRASYEEWFDMLHLRELLCITPVSDLADLQPRPCHKHSESDEHSSECSLVGCNGLDCNYCKDQWFRLFVLHSSWKQRFDANQHIINYGTEFSRYPIVGDVKNIPITECLDGCCAQINYDTRLYYDWGNIKTFLSTTNPLKGFEFSNYKNIVVLGKLGTGLTTEPDYQVFADTELKEFFQKLGFRVTEPGHIVDGRDMDRTYTTKFQYFANTSDQLMDEVKEYGINQTGSISTGILYLACQHVLEDVRRIMQIYSEFTKQPCTIIPTEQHVITRPHKSAGVPYNKVGDAQVARDIMGSERNALINHRTHALHQTIINVNNKTSVVGKFKCRPISGINVIESDVGRSLFHRFLEAIKFTCYTDKILIGWSKFNKGFDRILRKFLGDRDPELEYILSGKDFPKWDRSVESLFQLLGNCIVFSSYSWPLMTERKSLKGSWFLFMTEFINTVYSYMVVSGSLILKSGGVCSGNSKTANGNSIMHMMFDYAATTEHLCYYRGESADLIAAREFIMLHETTPLIKLAHVDQSAYHEYNKIMDRHYILRVLSDDGMALHSKELLPDFKQLFRFYYMYSNYLFTPDKYYSCKPEDGPHEFCSAETILVDDIYVPCPVPERLLGSLFYTNKTTRFDPDIRIATLSSFILECLPLLYNPKLSYKHRVLPLILLEYMKSLAGGQLNVNVVSQNFCVFGADAFFTALGTANDKWNFLLDIERYMSLYGFITPPPVTLDVTKLEAFNHCPYCNVNSMYVCNKCGEPFCNGKDSHAIRHSKELGHNVWNYNSRRIKCAVCVEEDIHKLFFIHSRGKSPYVACKDHVSDGDLFPLVKEGRFLFGDVIHGIELSPTYDYVNRWLQAPYGMHKFIISMLAGIRENTCVYYYSLVSLYERLLDRHSGFVEWEVEIVDPTENIFRIVGKDVVVNRHNQYCLVHGNEMNVVELSIAGLNLFKANRQVDPKDKIRCYRITSGLVKCLKDFKPFSPTRLQNQLMQYDLIYDEWPDLMENLRLNEYQRLAYDHVLNHNISIIQGPPGTGKTYVISQLVRNLVALGKTVLIASTSHAAVDNVTDACFKYVRCVQRNVPQDHADRVHCRAPAYVNGVPRVLTTTFQTSLPGNHVFDVLIVDEFSKVEDIYLFSMMQQARVSRVAFFGDQNQLGVIHPLGDIPKQYGNIMLFHAMKDPKNCIMLREQFRMHEDICAVVSDFMYDGKLISKTNYPDEHGPRRIQLVLTNSKPVRMVQGLYNIGVHDKAAETARYCRTMDPTRSIAMIVDYNLMYNYCVQHKLDDVNYNIYTIDQSQGKEFDNVIICLSDINEFTMDKYRINVAISRAKHYVFIVACDDRVYRYSPFERFKPKEVKLESIDQTRFMETRKIGREVAPFVAIQEAHCGLDIFAIDVEGVHVTIPDCKHLPAPFELGVKHHTGSALFAGKPCLYQNFTRKPYTLNRKEYRIPPGFEFYKSRLREYSFSFYDGLKDFVHYVFDHCYIRPIFVVFRGDLDRATLMPISRFGTEPCCHQDCVYQPFWYKDKGNYCDCYCSRHAVKPDGFYNPIFIDVGLLAMGNLEEYHAQFCDIIHPGEAHEARYDAQLAYCLLQKQRLVNLKHEWNYLGKAHYERDRAVHLRVLEEQFMLTFRDKEICDMGCGTQPRFKHGHGVDPLYNGETFDTHRCELPYRYYGNSHYYVDLNRETTPNIYVSGYFRESVYNLNDPGFIHWDNGYYYHVSGKRLHFHQLASQEINGYKRREWKQISFLDPHICCEETRTFNIPHDVHVELNCAELYSVKGSIFTYRCCLFHFERVQKQINAWNYLHYYSVGATFNIYERLPNIQNEKIILSPPSAPFDLQLPGYEDRADTNVGRRTIIKIKSWLSEYFKVYTHLYVLPFCYLGAASGNKFTPAADYIQQYTDVYTVDLGDYTTNCTEKFTDGIELYEPHTLFYYIYSDIYNLENKQEIFHHLDRLIIDNLIYTGHFIVKITSQFNDWEILEKLTDRFSTVILFAPPIGRITSEVWIWYVGYQLPCQHKGPSLESRYWGYMKELSVTGKIPTSKYDYVKVVRATLPSYIHYGGACKPGTIYTSTSNWSEWTESRRSALLSEAR
ncbi:hypothetical protein [Bradybaena similaris medionivirus]|nr:hypothetical protein [Bradybaena similaris medionivirus]